jgi:ubiquinone/menaquinone biosynthesis C-methylase UbiE
VNTTESKYVEKKAYLSRYTHERLLALGEKSRSRPAADSAQEGKWLRYIQEHLPKFIPFLIKKCGLEFRGRILEIGAGEAWLSAEISKLPGVVQVITTDFSPTLLKDYAPKVFKLLGAHGAKITRTPGDFHKLDFPNNHFDFVVCSAVLHHAVNVVQVLREAKRVLKPGGKLVAIREPIWPLVKLKSRTKKTASLAPEASQGNTYTLAHYKELFKQASLPLEVKTVNFSRGFRYYVEEAVNGLTHARYAFIGTKSGKGELPRKRKSQSRIIK